MTDWLIDSQTDVNDWKGNISFDCWLLFDEMWIQEPEIEI